MFSFLLGLSVWFDQLPYIHLFQPSKRYKYGTHLNALPEAWYSLRSCDEYAKEGDLGAQRA